MKGQTQQLAAALSCGLGLALLAVVLIGRALPTHASPGNIYVAPGGVCNPELTPCYGSLQQAVDAAPAGGTILVASGIYTGVQTRLNLKQLVLIDKSVTIRGGYTPNFSEPPSPTLNPTTLDAQRQGRVIVVTGTVDVRPDVTLDGLSITGGDSYQGGAPVNGGGIWSRNAKLTLSNSRVYGNGFGAHGGGMYLKSSDVRLTNNTINDNGVAGAGGGLNLDGSAATLDGNVIRANSASGSGGGLTIQGGVVTMTNNIVADNRVRDGKGSAIQVFSGALVRMLQNTLARNTGGDGTGISMSYSTLAITNTILVSHTIGISATTGTATADATLWGSGDWANRADTVGAVTSTTNVIGDPAFVDPANGNYHIGAGSAALDAGVNAGVMVDIDGEQRPSGSAFDIGADELSTDIATPTATETPVGNSTATPTATVTPTNSLTPTATANSTSTHTPTATVTPTKTPSPNSVATMYLSPSSAEVELGKTFTFDVWVDTGAQTVTAIDAFFDYEPSYLEIVGDPGNPVVGGAFISSTTMPRVNAMSVDNANGQAGYSAGIEMGEQSVSGTFRFVSIRLCAKGETPPGGTTVRFHHSGDDADDRNTILVNPSGNLVPAIFQPATVVVTTASLSGEVQLQARGSTPSTRWVVPLSVTLSLPGVITPTYTFASSVDEFGQFALQGIAPDTYDVRVRKPHSLINKRANVALQSGDSIVDMGMLLEGDANEDGAINALDYAILAGSYMKRGGQAGFDERADFNEDGRINASDYAPLAANYFKRNDIELPGANS